MRSSPSRLVARGFLKKTIFALEKLYGPPPPPVTDPFEMILLENCAYLVADSTRTRIFRSLKERIGKSPQAILSAPDAMLIETIREGGMRPPDRAAKLRRCAEILREIGPEELQKAVRADPLKARKWLKRFPGIGDPGADKILLFNRAKVTLAPDSNALRVLRRLGYGRELNNYSQTYRSVAEAVVAELPADFPWLISGHRLLRRHGQELCRRAAPRCRACPLSAGCVAFRTQSFGNL